MVSTIDFSFFTTEVDTGWVTMEVPMKWTESGAQPKTDPPLDCVDGAVRVLDPIYEGYTCAETPPFGIFIKDFQPALW